MKRYRNLERIVFKYLYNYLRDTNFISPHQSGFKPGDSTVHQLSYLYHTFCKALDEKKEVHIVFCDISKAFDRVWHKGLLYKLKKAGISGNLLAWFANYLSDRYQQVVIRGQNSEKGLIKAGVPQGSVLGPLLFLIYINDITNITNCNIKLFADDTSLYIEFDDNQTATDQLNTDLTNIQSWADQWLVNFSPPKTKLMTCSFKKSNRSIAKNVTFNNTVLTSVKCHKHLGLILSDDLTWSKHIESILKNVSPLTDVLKKLKYDVDRKSLELTYLSFIRPQLEYGCHIWDNCSKQDSDMLENVQLDMARIVTGARKGTSHALLYEDTNWQLLKERRHFFKFKNFIKVINGEAPAYLQSLIPGTVGSVRPISRNATNFINIKARTETLKTSFIPSAIRIWNNTGPEERLTSSVIQAMKIERNKLFYFGKRAENVIHAQLRLSCSKLNSHLFALHVVDSPACICGHDNEDSEHFLLYCALYDNIRPLLIHTLHDLIEDQHLNIVTLLNGNNYYDYTTNCKIFQAVHSFLSRSNRF